MTEERSELILAPPEGFERAPYEAAEGRQIGIRDTGRNYVFLLNTGTFLGDLHAGQFRIGLGEDAARAFAAAPEVVRQTLVVQHAKAAEARAAANRKGLQR